ncbi:hypothetical protein CR513_15286, partial [Mucuna pruriens]
MVPKNDSTSKYVLNIHRITRHLKDIPSIMIYKGWNTLRGKMILKAMEIKGHVVNRLPLFKGQNYDYWKQRMMAFFDASHIDMWDVVENDNYIPTNKEEAEIPKSLWNKEQKTRYLLNLKARNFLMYALTQ